MEEKSRMVEEMWALVRETKKNLKELAENQKEREIQREKAQKERDREIEEMKAMQKATDRQIRKTERSIDKVSGRFNERWGALVESLVEGKLVKVFREKGIDISETYPRATGERRDEKGILRTREADIIVANGTEVVLVEVKTSLTKKDVSVFLESLKDFKRYFKRYDSEVLYGAVAYLKSEIKAHQLAEKEGLFIIKATGDSASLMNQEDFKPKAFQ